jgi:hypothetical protein
MALSGLTFWGWGGQISGFTTAQIAAIETRDIAVFSSAQLAGLNASWDSAYNQIAALTTAQIQALPLTSSWEYWYENGYQQSGYRDKLNLTSVQISALTTDDVVALSTRQVAALTTQQVSALTTNQLAVMETIDLVALQTSSISGLSTYQLSSLTTSQVVALTTNQFSALTGTGWGYKNGMWGYWNGQIEGLTTTQIAVIETRDIAALSSSVIAGLATSQIQALSTDQVASIGIVQSGYEWNSGMNYYGPLSPITSTAIMQFGTDDIAALTTTQFNALTMGVIPWMSSAQIAAIETRDIQAMGSRHFAMLSSVQLGALSTAQLSAIETADFVGIASSAMRGFTTASITALGQSYGYLTTSQIGSLLSQQINAMGSSSIPAFAMVTPVVLDLNGDGIQTVNITDGVKFDINNDGKADQTAWVARGDGLLVRDINKDGQINNGSELFGSATSLGNGKTAADGYVAMRALDTNKDGVLDANDAAFGELMVWTDLDGNGITGANELTNLSDLGINSISLNATKSTQNNNGNLIGLMGSYTTTDGKTHTMGDVWFQTDAAGDRVFDLAAIAKAAGTSKVDMSNAQGDTLKVTLADVLAVGTPDILSGTSTVTITGDSGDVVQLTGSAGAGWSLAGTQTDGADTYMVYVNQNAHLMVNDKIHLIIS